MREFMMVRMRCFWSKLRARKSFARASIDAALAGRIGLAEIVGRIDEALAHQIRPDTVGLSPGEERVVGPGHPVGQEQQPIIAARQIQGPVTQQPRLHDFAGIRMLDLALVVKEDDLFADELMAVEFVLAFVVDDLVLDAREEGGKLVVIVLRPAIERVVVALGTLHAHAEKNLGSGLGPGVGVAQGPVVVGSRLLVGAAPAGDQLPGQQVERLVVGHRLAEPFVEHLHALAIELLFLVAEQVGPFEGPELGILRPLEQGID